jgi:hypothetical protein
MMLLIFQKDLIKYIKMFTTTLDKSMVNLKTNKMLNILYLIKSYI